MFANTDAARGWATVEDLTEGLDDLNFGEKKKKKKKKPAAEVVRQT